VQGVLAPLSGPTAALQGVAALLLVFAAVHGAQRYGWSAMLMFFVTTAVTSFLFEVLSLRTGFPFGHYHHLLQPQVLGVPLPVPFGYVAIGYIAWQVANALLDLADAHLTEYGNLVALPSVAAVLATMYDLTVDPAGATIAHSWVWEQGGGFFGVPYTNFLGWLLTTYVFLQLFAVYLWMRPRRRPKDRPTAFFAAPVIIYLSLGVTTISLFVSSRNQTVTDGAGVSWNVHSIRESSMIAALFTIIFVSALTLLRIIRVRQLREPFTAS
jgi:putative membrane protein